MSKISETDHPSILSVNFSCQNRNIPTSYDIKSIWKIFGKSKATDSSAEIKTWSTPFLFPSIDSFFKTLSSLPFSLIEVRIGQPSQFSFDPRNSPTSPIMIAPTPPTSIHIVLSAAYVSSGSSPTSSGRGWNHWRPRTGSPAGYRPR